MKVVKEGSRWAGSNGTYFHVIHVVELNGHTWVHYIQDGINESKEHSCYIESFIHRFTEVQQDTSNRVR